MPFCVDCAAQYYTSKEAHLTRCNGGVLVFSDKCYYTRDLIDFCRRHKIVFKVINSVDPWVRDYFLETPSKLYIRNKNSEYAIGDNYSSAGIDPVVKAYSYDSGTYGVFPKMLDHTKRSIDSSLFPVDYEIKSTNRALEGGNLFICENIQGVKYYIIGQNALEGGEHRITNFKHPSYNPDERYSSPIVPYDEQRYINRYKKIFEVDDISSRLLVLPNLTYHLDLYIAYVAKGTFIINDFADAVKKTHKDHGYDKLGAPDYSEEYHKTMKVKVAIAQKIIKTLEKNDFAVKTCVATTYGLMDEDEAISAWRGNAHTSSLINGIHLISNVDGRCYFLTIDTHDHENKRIMRDQLHAFGVTIIYIKADGLNPEETQNDAISESGALRCQTIMLSKLAVREITNISATKIQRLFKRYKSR